VKTTTTDTKILAKKQKTFGNLLKIITTFAPLLRFLPFTHNLL
jgi:hypothetical protein